MKGTSHVEEYTFNIFWKSIPLDTINFYCNKIIHLAAILIRIVKWLIKPN